MPKVKFTKQALSSLERPASASITYYQDTEAPGLNAGVTRAGAITFYWRGRIGGKPETIKLGRFPAMTIEQARRKAAGINGTVAEGGESPNEVRRQVKNELLLSKIFDRFIAEKRKKNGDPLAQRTKDGYANDWKLHCAPLHARTPSQVLPEDVQNLYLNIGATHPTTANRVRAMLSSLFSWATAKRLAKLNPVEEVPKEFAEVRRSKWAKPEKMPLLLIALEYVESETGRDFILLAMLTGYRRSNVCAMRFSDLDLERAVVRRQDEERRGGGVRAHGF